MTSKTEYLGLNTYDTLTDASSVLIYKFIEDTTGCSVTSNVGLIDAYAIQSSASIADISASIIVIEQKIDVNKSAVVQITAPSVVVDATSLFYLRAPSEINGLNLVRAQAFVNTASASGISASMTVQVRNMTKYSENDSLSTPIIILSGCEIGVPGIIDPLYDDISTDDKIKIYVGDVSSGSPKGLQAVLEYA